MWSWKEGKDGWKLTDRQAGRQADDKARKNPYTLFAHTETDITRFLVLFLFLSSFNSSSHHSPSRLVYIHTQKSSSLFRGLNNAFYYDSVMVLNVWHLPSHFINENLFTRGLGNIYYNNVSAKVDTSRPIWFYCR